MSRNFRELLEAKWAERKFVCVGLDSELTKIPEIVRNSSNTTRGILVKFNRNIIAATRDLVLAYKPNIAFYEAHGGAGLLALKETIEEIHKLAPDVPVILDAKRADIGNTNNGYVEMAFTELNADAITVHPYLGSEALKPFLDRKDKGIIVLCKTSNPGAGEFQDLPVTVHSEERVCLEKAGAIHGWMTQSGCYTKLFIHLAYKVSHEWNNNSNCCVVVGATYPDELRQVRGIVDDMPVLIPGIGAQGGDIEKTVKAGIDSRGRGMIINSSRGIIFASSGTNYAEMARLETVKLQSQIERYLPQEVKS